MAYGRSFIQPEDDYALKVVGYFNDIRQIKDDVERMKAIMLGEGFLNNLLEGSEYYESKKRLQVKIAEDQKKGQKYSISAYGTALVKLQQRAANEANIFGKRKLTAVPRRGEDTEKVMDSLEGGEEEDVA
jgi:hypothetical protein